MKKLVFSGTGYPVHIKTLQYLQDNTLHGIKALAQMHENYTVLWGIEPTTDNSQITEGAFVLNGEIIPFQPSVPGENVTINIITENADFNTNPNNTSSVESLPAYSYKSAQIGSGGSVTFLYSQLKRLPKTKIFQLADIEFTGSGGFIRDITPEVDVNIIKRAFDWDLCWIEENESLNTKMVRNLKQHNGSTIENAGFINDAKLLYTPTSARIQLNISNPPIKAPKLIIHYI